MSVVREKLVKHIDKSGAGSDSTVIVRVLTYVTAFFDDVLGFLGGRFSSNRLSSAQ